MTSAEPPNKTYAKFGGVACPIAAASLDAVTRA